MGGTAALISLRMLKSVSLVYDVIGIRFATLREFIGQGCAWFRKANERRWYYLLCLTVECNIPNFYIEVDPSVVCNYLYKIINLTRGCVLQIKMSFL